MSPNQKIIFYTPTFTPVGGVVKIFDYMNHAVELGYDAEIVCPKPLEDTSKIWQLEQFTDLLRRFKISRDVRQPMGPTDIAFFSWPTHYEHIVRAMDRAATHHQILHIVQNVRHGNPAWIDGYATRLLARPMSRVMISTQVMEACDRWLNPSSPTVTIVEGHRWEYFEKDRGPTPLGTPMKVAYTTWKSDVGVEVERILSADERFSFRSIRGPAGWREVRDLYHWADVVLGCPGAEEGFYLVGLEAMAASAILIMSDAVGNRAYARWGENCVQVGHDDAASYVRALDDISRWSASTVMAMRSSGLETLSRHSLAAEKRAFGNFLETEVVLARAVTPEDAGVV